MKHRKLFIGSIVSIPIGIALILAGIVIAPLGCVVRYPGNVVTWVYYLGLWLLALGLITTIEGTSGIAISLILERLAKRKKREG